jgi:hypothetical protein
MRLVCPSCGAIASLEAWSNDAAWRKFAELLVKLPGTVQERALPYLGLFRQGDRGLTPRRAVKLIGDLMALVDPGTVHWDGGETRPASAALWAAALDATLARRPQGLTNHNYLRHVAWEMARNESASRESTKESRESRVESRESACHSSLVTCHDQAGDRASVQKMLKAFTQKLGGEK